MMPPRRKSNPIPTIVRPTAKAKRLSVPKIANPGITYYKQNKYRLMNDYLRTGKIYATAVEKERIEANIRYIDSVMHAGLDTAVCPELYRGTGYDEFGFLREDFNRLKEMVGKRTTWKSFISTSVDKRKAEKFSHGVLIIFKPTDTIRFVDMTRYGSLKFQGEKEILLDKNLTGTITDVKMAKSASGLKVYAEVIVQL